MVNLHIAWKVQTNHLEFCYLILLEGMKIYNLDLLYSFNFSFCFLGVDDRFFLFIKMHVGEDISAYGHNFTLECKFLNIRSLH